MKVQHGDASGFVEMVWALANERVFFRRAVPEDVLQSEQEDPDAAVPRFRARLHPPLRQSGGHRSREFHSKPSPAWAR